MPKQIIDKKWADGVGLAVRPWVPSDHLTDRVIEDVTVMNVANDKAFYVPVGTEFNYLRGNQVKEVADKVKYPTGQGMWFRSVTLRRCVADGVARKDNAKIQGAHTDGCFINGDAASNALGGITDFTFEDCVFRNLDGSCMPVLLCEPVRLGTLTFRRTVMEPTVVQPRIVLKGGISVNVMRFEDCPSGMKLSPDVKPFYIGRIEISNSPLVNVKDVIKTNPDCVVILDGVQIAGPAVPSVPAPLPPPVADTPAPSQEVVQLRSQVATLEAENTVLKTRLNQINALTQTPT